ncbi:MAG: Phage integrase family [Pseudomonadota bacterium]|jgi:hypothetical protein
MPWIDQTKNGYIVRWREGGRTSPIKSTPLIERKDEAQAAKRRIETELAAKGQIRHGVDVPMDELLMRWKARRLARGGRLIHVAKELARLTSLTNDNAWTTCRAVTPESVEKWRQAGGSPRAGAYLRAVLSWASETLDQAVDHRTLVALRPQPTTRRAKPPLATSAQLTAWQALADDASPSAGALLHCLATYGWRPITAADLRVRHLDLARGTITTTVKGGDVIEHPLLPDTIHRLRPLVAGRKPDDALFVDPRTDRAWIADSSARGSIVDWCNALGLRSYDLKRWAISGMLSRGLPPQTVRLFTGHRTISQVLTYATTNEDVARQALAHLVSPPSTTEHGHRQRRTKPVNTPKKTPTKRRIATR